MCIVIAKSNDATSEPDRDDVAVSGSSDDEDCQTGVTATDAGDESPSGATGNGNGGVSSQKLAAQPQLDDLMNTWSNCSSTHCHCIVKNECVLIVALFLPTMLMCFCVDFLVHVAFDACSFLKVL